MGFAERLKELRDVKNLSQDELADILNIPRSSISHYERTDLPEGEQRTPRRDRLKQIADYFGVNIDYLLGHTNDPTPLSSGSILKKTKNAAIDWLKDETSEVRTSSFWVKEEKTGFTTDEQRVLNEMKKYPAFFNDLASDPSKIKKVIKMWEFIKSDIENDDDEEPED